MDDLVKRLRAFANGCRGSIWQSRDETIRLCDDAADAIEALQARVAELERCPIGATYPTCSAGTCHRCLVGQVRGVRDELSAARRDAFEEAAKVADKWAADQQRQFGNGGPASAIRDLAEKG